MRYLYLLFFCFLSLHSYLVFAQEPSCTGSYGQSTCQNIIASWESYEDQYSYCRVLSNGYLYETCTTTRCPSPLINSPTAPTTCVCPEGQAEYILDPSGSSKTCGPICVSPQISNIVTSGGTTTVSCIDPPDQGDGDDDEDPICEESEKVYDPVSGSMVCPASGDGNSSAATSSQMCVVPGDFNGDCVPDDDQASSANNSTPTSSPDSGSAASTGSGGGGDDDGGNPSTGGGDNGGGSNTGGGSGSAAASSTPSGSNSSWTPISGYGNWIPVNANSTCPNKFQDQTGQWWCSGGNSGQFGSSASQMAISGECDYTSKTYFSCITAQTISGGGSGSNSSWTPVSGYGNWIPVAEDSPCPNKFKDASGKWWCAGGGSGSGSGGAAGSSGSASGGAAGSAASAAGECDQTSRDYLECISSGKSSRGSASSVSSGSASAASSSARSGAFSSLGEKGEFDGEASEKKLEDLTEELEKKIADIKADVQGEFGGSISGSGSIQDFCKNIRSAEVCFGLKKWEPFLDPISAAIFLVACVISFAIVLRG